MSKTRALVTTLGLCLMIGLIACALVSSASAQTGGAANQIIIRSQETGTGQIIVDTVIAAQDGWLVVYTDTHLSARSMVGWASVHQGVNTNLKVNIDSEKAEPEATLWAVLYIDRGAIGQLELPVIDGPVQENGKTVMVAFGTQAPPVVAAPPAIAATPKAQATAKPPSTLPPAGASRFPIAVAAMLMLGSALVIAAVALLRSKARRASANRQVVR